MATPRVLLLAAALLASASEVTAQAAAPAASAHVGQVTHTAADTRFMQQMIPHHEQALAMAALVPARAARPELRLLAERIEVSQKDEIALMRQWLADRHEPLAPEAHAHHGADPAAGHVMNGMLSEAQMRALAAATGPAFDRLFLEGMIQHHEGAVRMVEALLAAPGAAQESATNRFATDVFADQRAEIARMKKLLATLR